MWQEKYRTKANTLFPKFVNLRSTDLPRHPAADLSNTVAGMHLTLRGLRGTVEGPDHTADCPCATSANL
jgi:hypothetical protein